MQGDKSEPKETKGTECLSASDTAKALSNEDPGTPKAKGINAVAVLWTFGKCLGALLPVYLAGYYRVSTSLLVFGMMVYTGWKHAREAKEARLKSAIQMLNEEEEDELMSSKVSKIKRELPAWVGNHKLLINYYKPVPQTGPHMDTFVFEVCRAQDPFILANNIIIL